MRCRRRYELFSLYCQAAIGILGFSEPPCVPPVRCHKDENYSPRAFGRRCSSYPNTSHGKQPWVPVRYLRNRKSSAGCLKGVLYLYLLPFGSLGIPPQKRKAWNFHRNSPMTLPTPQNHSSSAAQAQALSHSSSKQCTSPSQPVTGANLIERANDFLPLGRLVLRPLLDGRGVFGLDFFHLRWL